MAATKAVKKSGCWNKLYVIHGEPTQCRLAKSAVLHQADVELVICVTGDDSVESINTTLHSMCFSTTALVINHPTSDQCKLVLDAIENNKCKPDVILIVVSGEYLDARWTLTTAAVKQKRIYAYDFILDLDRSGLTSYLKSWSELNDIKIEHEAQFHIFNHGPTICAKIKGGNGQKKDAIIYNLEALVNELDKIVCLTDGKTITLSLLTKYCTFDRADDIWSFVRIAVGGSPQDILNKLESCTVGQSMESALWMLLSQIDFLFQVSKAGSTDPYVVTERLSLEGVLGAYLTEDFDNPPNIEIPIVNNWRVRKALEDRSIWAKVNLQQSYKAVVSALQDLRGKLDEKIVVLFLSLALAGLATYDSPLIGSFD